MSSTLNPKRFLNKRVLLRVDLNLPMLNGNILSMARWKNVLPTIQSILSASPKKLIIMTHLGQPKGYDPAFSLSHIVDCIKEDVPNIKLIASTNESKQDGVLFLLENVRFDSREKTTDVSLVREYLSEVDMVIFDAFSVGHRNHASVCGIMGYASNIFFGPHFLKEKNEIDKALLRPGKRIAILSGSKVSTKLPILKKMLTWADHILVGGGIANTLLHLKGFNMQKSLVDLDALNDATHILEQGDKIILPVDGVTQDQKIVEFEKNNLSAMDAILDIGPKTCQLFASYIDQTDTILWNGPMGYYEDEKFQLGTQKIALAIGESNAYAVVGGGDSVAAVEDLNLEQQFNYISTSGGAFLYYIAHGSLPVVDAARSNKLYTSEVAE